MSSVLHLDSRAEVITEQEVAQREAFINEKYVPTRMAQLEKMGHLPEIARRYGVPTAVIRSDEPPHSDPEHRYEDEDESAGQGSMLKVLPDPVKRIWAESFEQIGINGIYSDVDYWVDDESFAKELGLRFAASSEEVLNDDGLWWVRVSEDHPHVEGLEERSALPIRNRWHKGYLVTLELAKEIRSLADIPAKEHDNPEIRSKGTMQFTEPFVVKPLNGSMARGVGIFMPNSYYKKIGKPNGRRTWTWLQEKLESSFQNGHSFLVQPFYPPEIVDGICKTWRLFFVYVPSEGRYRFAGGVWNSRPTLIVHGASDASFGLVLPEDR